MSESEDSGPGRREVAHRIFAAEFDDAEFSYSESDEERAPNYVVTPTGARVNRLFVVGVLTELEQVNDDVLRARIVDPTGPFVVYAGQYQPEALAFLEAATPPLFVAITGKARTFEPEDGDRVFTSIRPESISEVDAETRDRWVVQATEQTVDRVGRLASAKRSGLSGGGLRSALAEAGVGESDAAGAALALDYYGTTGDYLQAVRDLALNAARVVAGQRDEAGSLSLSPDDGTDDPLPVLASMDLDAPAASSADAGEPDAADVDDADESASAEPPTSEEPSAAGSTPTEKPTTAADTSEPPEPETAPSETEPSTETDTSTTSESIEVDETPEPTTEPVSAGEDTDDGSSGTLGDFDSGDETAASTDAETEPTTADVEPTAEAESAGSESEPASATTATDPTAADATDDDVGDFDTEFELDEDEREEIEQEYGTDFQSGTEVDDAGEADIETPDPEELAEAEAMDPNEMADAETEAEAEAAEEGRTAESAEERGPDEAATGGEPAEDVDLEDAVMAVMTDLNDGSGADREAVITEVVSEHGADREAVEAAVQDALMSGRCYEPEDGKLTPI